MHCGKALIRSRLWQPEHWDTSTDSLGARQLAPVLGDNSVEKTEALLEKAYIDELY